VKLVELLVFFIFYFLAVAIVSSLFNPGMYSVGTGAPYPPGMHLENWQTGGATNPGDVTYGWQFMSFIGAGLSLNIPDIPAIVRIVMLLPMYGALAYFIWCNLPVPFRKEG
jgi:hypothetical protein